MTSDKIQLYTKSWKRWGGSSGILDIVDKEHWNTDFEDREIYKY
jgi:hypothetical protein